MRQMGDQTTQKSIWVVYKYRLLPQSSVGPNSTWLGHTEENPQYKASSIALAANHDKFFYP
jgi:hypothetical protein